MLSTAAHTVKQLFNPVAMLSANCYERLMPRLCATRLYTAPLHAFFQHQQTQPSIHEQFPSPEPLGIGRNAASSSESTMSAPSKRLGTLPCAPRTRRHHQPQPTTEGAPSMGHAHASAQVPAAVPWYHRLAPLPPQRPSTLTHGAAGQKEAHVEQDSPQAFSGVKQDMGSGHAQGQASTPYPSSEDAPQAQATDNSGRNQPDAMQGVGKASSQADVAAIPPGPPRKRGRPKGSVAGAARMRTSQAQTPPGPSQHEQLNSVPTHDAQTAHDTTPSHLQGESTCMAAVAKGGRRKSKGEAQGSRGHSQPRLVWFPAVRVLSNAAEGVLEILQDSQSDPFQTFAELQDFLGLGKETLIAHLLELCSHGLVDQAYILQLCGITTEQQPSSEEACLTYADIRAALEAVKPGGAKQRTQAKHLLALRHEQAVAVLGEDKLDLQVLLVHKMMMEDQRQQMLAEQQQLFLANSMHARGPTAAPYMVGCVCVCVCVWAAYLEGMSLQQLRELKPSSRKDLLTENTVQESLLDALKLGVPLPVHRLAQDFKFEGDKVYRQEARLGDNITLKQIRLVSYLHKLQQALRQQQQQWQQQQAVFIASKDDGSQTRVHFEQMQQHQQGQQQQKGPENQRGGPGDDSSRRSPSKPSARLKARRVRRA
ncbi:hypothetical protein DUNSADRAFT_12153 [Dunaliella salina]|uniref:Uncharacterized protein n=1 Tax=Dunaliella salina TaxID=3046 RepID=A0ABQ7GBW7_DUNSA|nr:hypothetical protein DUNSADRAFT_12153 [Dunaliella salina]|eukprot:KAF5832104.1 hypothetical protein DUNSADRAFT_12153 [Dunaliella salina]